MKTDSLFYRLFQTLPQLLFDLIAHPSDHAPRYQFSSVDIKLTGFRIDGVFLPPATHADWPLFFVEVQFQPDPDLYSRLFAEIFLYLRQQRPVHPWRAVVIYPTRKVDPEDTHPHYRVLLESAHFTRVYLDEWTQPRRTLSQQVIGMLLADPRQVVAEARTVLVRVRREVSEDARLVTALVNLVETILVYKLPELRREDIQTMLELRDTDLKQTRFYQEVFTEGVEEGVQRGEQKGRQEGEASLILRLLQRRCGEVAPAVQERIAKFDLARLDALGEALLEFHGVADLELWLAAHGDQ